MKIKTLIILLIIFVIGWISYLFPASLAWKMVRDQAQIVNPQKISGNIWNAKFTKTKIDKIEIDSISSSLKPLQILLGAASTDFVIRENKSTVNGYVKKTILSDSISINNITGNLAIVDILKIVRTYSDILIPIPVDGNIKLNIDDITLLKNNKVPSSIEGNLHASNLNIAGIELKGVYVTEISTNDDGIINIKFKDSKAADLNLGGNATINQDGEYQANIRVSIKTTTKGPIVTMLGIVGIKKGRTKKFTFSGIIKQ